MKEEENKNIKDLIHKVEEREDKNMIVITKLEKKKNIIKSIIKLIDMIVKADE